MDTRDRDRGDKDRLDLEEPLGIAHASPPKDDRIRASMDEDSVRRRRRRALGSDVDEDRRTIVGESDDPEGATGMDMGGGGDGHGIKRSR
jgi:hypothetical protein